MNLIKKAATAALACACALAIAACGGQSGQPSGDSSAPADQTVPGAIVLTGTETEIPPVEVTLKDGESLAVMGILESGELEAAESKDGEWLSTDYLYEGSSVSVGGQDAGTYTIEFTVVEPSKGTVYVLSVPAEVADSLDFENSDADAIIQQILDSVG